MNSVRPFVLGLLAFSTACAPFHNYAPMVTVAENTESYDGPGQIWDFTRFPGKTKKTLFGAQW